jgi:hypothetical protein
MAYIGDFLKSSPITVTVEAGANSATSCVVLGAIGSGAPTPPTLAVLKLGPRERRVYEWSTPCGDALRLELDLPDAGSNRLTVTVSQDAAHRYSKTVTADESWSAFLS